MPEAFKNISVLLTANNTQLKSSLAQSSAAVKAFDRDIEKSNKTLSNTGKLMIGGLAAGATAVAAGLMYAVVQANAFDKAMRNVNSLTGMGEKDFAALEKRVIGLSKVLPQSATTLAEGLYDIASSGFQGADGMKVLESAAMGASAGLTTTATSAKAITAVLNAYGRDASDAADVTDVLFQTVNLGVVSFDELAGSIGDVVGIAAPLGVEIEELGSAIATMTTQGVSGSESTTLLTNLFTKMLRPSENLKEMMKGLGYESGEAMLKANGLRGTMEILRGEVGNSAQAWMEIFPDIQAARGALALAANEGQNYAAAAAKIEDAEARRGATQKTLNEQMKSLSAQMTLAKNQVNALATELGLKLLPGIIGMIDGGRELGGVLKDNIGRVIEALAPTWANLADILRDSWEIFRELGEAIGPVAGALTTLAVGGVVLTLNALTTILSTLVSLLADNEEIALTLAIALGIHLLGGVAALATKLQVALVLSLVNTIGAMGSAAAAAAGLNIALLGSVAALGGISAVIAGALIAFKGYRDGAGQAKDALQEWQEAQRSDALDTQIGGVKELTADLDGLKNRLNELDNRSILSQIFDVGAASEELGIRRKIQEVAEEADKAQQAMFNLQGAVVKYEAAARGMSGIEAFEEFGTAEQGAKLLAERLPVLTAAGVELGDSYETVKNKLDAYNQSQEVGSGATKDLVEALGQLEGGAVDTEQALDDLKDALDRIVGVFLDADGAAIAFEASLDDLVAVTKESTTETEINSEAGRKNRSAIIDAVDALIQQIDASARAGAGTDELSEKLTVGRERLIAAGEAAGFSRDQMLTLLEQYNLTPELVNTIVQALGTDTAKNNVNAVQDALNALSDKTVNVKVNYSAARAANEHTARRPGNLSQADGGIVSYYADGGVESHVAQIAPAGAWRVWAEPETGGEAYIPLAPQKRGRSTQILEEVANRFGARVEYNAEGSITASKVYGDAIDIIKKMAPPMPAATSGMGYRAMMELLRMAFPGLALISGLRPGAITATGNPSYHGKGRAVDIPPRRDVFEWIRAGYAALTKELIFSPMGARQIHNGRSHVYTGITKKMHYDHIHWAMSQGGILNPHVRDSGGPLLPGYTFNGTGKPEMVVPMANGGIVGGDVIRYGQVPQAKWDQLLGQGWRGLDDGMDAIYKPLGAVVKLGEVSKEYWNRLLALGWKGDPKDGMEALYRPLGAVTAAGKSVPLAGGPKSPIPAGHTLSSYAKLFDDPKDIRDLVAAWDKYNQALEQAERRAQLVADANKKVEGAAQALAEFDAAARIEREREATDKYIESLERQAEIQAKLKQEMIDSLQRQQERTDNQFGLGQYPVQWYLRDLESRMLAEERFSSEWTALQQRRLQILEDIAQKEMDSLRNRNELGKITDATYLRQLAIKLAAEKKYSNEWMAIQREITSVLDGAKSKQQETLATVNRMLEEESAARKRMTQAQELYAERVEAANERARESIESLIESRREAILGWMRLDDQMESRSGSFALTSDDEESARNALRAAGLLTEAMQAWTDSQGEGPMSASALILNAREQTELINQWTQGLQDLRARGLSDEVIDALGLGDSPEALSQIQAFSTATQQEIQDLNAAVIERTKAANVQVSREQSQLFTSLGEALADIRRELNEEIGRANEDLQSELADATEQLNSIGKDQGLSYAEAIAAGLESGIPAIRAAVEEAKKAMAELTQAQKAATPLPPKPTTGAGAPGVAAPGAPPKGTSGSFMLNGQMVHVNAAGIIDTPGAYYGKYPSQVMSYAPAPSAGLAAPGAPPKGTAGSFLLNGQMVHVNAAGIIDTPGPYYGKYPTEVLQQKTFDRGGILPPGTTMLATNKTGEDEYVMRKAQLAVFGQLAARMYGGASQGQRPINVEYNVDARGAVEGTAKMITSALEDHTEALLRVVGAGVS